MHPPGPCKEKGRWSRRGGGRVSGKAGSEKDGASGATGGRQGDGRWAFCRAIVLQLWFPALETPPSPQQSGHIRRGAGDRGAVGAAVSLQIPALCARGRWGKANPRGRDGPHLVGEEAPVFSKVRTEI